MIPLLNLPTTRFQITKLNISTISKDIIVLNMGVTNDALYLLFLLCYDLLKKEKSEKRKGYFITACSFTSRQELTMRVHSRQRFSKNLAKMLKVQLSRPTYSIPLFPFITMQTRRTKVQTVCVWKFKPVVILLSEEIPIMDTNNVCKKFLLGLAALVFLGILIYLWWEYIGGMYSEPTAGKFYHNQCLVISFNVYTNLN